MLRSAVWEGPDEMHDWTEAGQMSVDGRTPAAIHVCPRCGIQLWEGSAGSLAGALASIPSFPRTCAEAVVASVMRD